MNKIQPHTITKTCTLPKKYTPQKKTPTNAEKKSKSSKNLRPAQNLPVITEDMVKSPSNQSMARPSSGTELSEQQGHKGNTHFMRKIPPGAEASNILVGEVDFLERTLSCFIRLSQAAVMGDLTEVPVPTRYLSKLNIKNGLIKGYFVKTKNNLKKHDSHSYAIQ